MKEWIKDLLKCVLICSVIIGSGVLICKYAPQNTGKAKMTMGKYIQNNNYEAAWGRLELGMTKDQVKAVWGNCMNRKFKHNGKGNQEKLYYSLHLGVGYVLTFENGVLVGWGDTGYNKM